MQRKVQLTGPLPLSPSHLGEGELPHHRGKVWWRAAGRLQVYKRGLSPWIILVRTPFPWKQPPRAVEGNPVEQITKLDVSPLLRCKPRQPILSLPVRTEWTINMLTGLQVMVLRHAR